MLLRSASSPLLNSRAFLHSAEAHLATTPAPSASPAHKPTMPRVLSERDLRCLPSAILKDQSIMAVEASISLAEEGDGGGRMFPGSVKPGYGGSEGRGGHVTDEHYQQQIDTDPENPLLLTNYAKFLKEVVGDRQRAREYLERVIAVSPGEGDALTLYAGIVWEEDQDADRANDYFQRAVQAAPNDCYLLGAYAGFLWDVDDDKVESPSSSPPPLQVGTSQSDFQRGATFPAIAAGVS